MPQCAAADLWLNTAPAPPDSTAAIQRPSAVRIGVADRVDAGVHSVQPAARQPQLDCPAAKPGIEELRYG